MNQRINKILQEIEKVIVGKNEVVEKVMMAVLAGGHVLMEDVPGVGKTTMAMAFARVLGLDTKRVQFTSDTVPSDIIGYSVYEKESGSFVFKPGAVMTNLLLADEINRTSSKTQSALLEAMEELRVTVDGQTYPLPSPFLVLATQNPVGSAGTQMLPSAQMDRFMIKISMGYPDFKSQINILKDRHNENPLDKVNAAATVEELQEMVKETSRVEVHDLIYEYVTNLAQATREHPMVQLGISPRGALAVCRMAKAYAYLNGRDYVIPEDVAEIFPDVCRHRLVLATKARMMEEKPETIIASIVKEVKMPVIKVERK
ncbi:MAG: MoxR family ATPase [Lachnospiraceae bacterium]|nr:MoxR family ATPase [Lachnospiraceae bacterium]